MYPGSEREAIQPVITNGRHRCLSIGTYWLVSATILLQLSYFIPVSSSGLTAQFTPELWLSHSLQLLCTITGFILSAALLTKRPLHKAPLRLFQVTCLTLSWCLAIYHVGFSWEQPTGAGHLTLFATFTFVIALYASERLLLIPMAMLLGLHLSLRLPLTAGAEITDFLTVIRQPLIGAMAFFSLNYWLRAALSREQENLMLTAEITRQAETDALTGLANRRCFDLALNAALDQAQSQGHKLAMIILDIDYFKRVNDQSGHPAGDQCLREVADVISTVALSNNVLAARVGGEEFALLLAGHASESALAIAQQLKTQLHEAAIEHPDSPLSTYLTVSQGVGTLTEGMNASALYSSADEALYYAKKHGRNQACSIENLETTESSACPQ